MERLRGFAARKQRLIKQLASEGKAAPAKHVAKVKVAPHTRRQPLNVLVLGKQLAHSSLAHTHLTRSTYDIRRRQRRWQELADRSAAVPAWSRAA